MKKVINLIKNLSLTTFILLALLHTGVLVDNSSVSAAPCEPESSILGVPTWYKYLDGEDIQGKCRPVIDTSKDTLPIGLAIFEIMLGVAGLVAVIMIFVGSFKYVITVGEPDKATGARKTVINALIGLAITVIAARVVSFFAGRLAG